MTASIRDRTAREPLAGGVDLRGSLPARRNFARRSEFETGCGGKTKAA
jgi:hypothetical protein